MGLWHFVLQPATENIRNSTTNYRGIKLPGKSNTFQSSSPIYCSVQGVRRMSCMSCVCALYVLSWELGVQKLRWRKERMVRGLENHTAAPSALFAAPRANFSAAPFSLRSLFPYQWSQIWPIAGEVFKNKRRNEKARCNPVVTVQKKKTLTTTAGSFWFQVQKRLK